MLNPITFVKTLQQSGIQFYTGVPDSLLKNFCSALMATLPSACHLTAANEGGAIALATGHYLATGRPALVYMQNSGQGNTINPLVSLAAPEVYGIPMLLLVGWRGEPGTKDEPQHVKQGNVTPALFEALHLPFEILSGDPLRATEQIQRLLSYTETHKEPVALLVGIDTFETFKAPTKTHTQQPQTEREAAIEVLLGHAPTSAAFVSTTGHTSRELYECRERRGEGHERDFLTVGSMGHASQIALGLALAQPSRPVFCLDGDGAALMHMGALAIIGQSHALNLTHVLLNNGMHASVGGQETVGLKIDFCSIARACGYASAHRLETLAELKGFLSSQSAATPELPHNPGPVFIELPVSGYHRADLGRPSSSPAENKDALIAFLRGR